MHPREKAERVILAPHSFPCSCCCSSPARGRDIRFREVKNAIVKHEDCQMFRESYVSSEGKEYFISFETKDRQSLLGFIRVRINDNPTCSVFTDLHNAVLIRELHVYGKLVKQDDAAKFGSVQHMGIGKRLLAEARQLAIDMGYSKLAVIAGVGTTQYYQKQGFALSKNKGSYMIKQLVVVPRIAKSMFCIFAKTISIVNFVFQSRSYCDDICALM
jgi:histone acetyltransferase (RNA polymerase elongator complex component)